MISELYGTLPTGEQCKLSVGGERLLLEITRPDLSIGEAFRSDAPVGQRIVLSLFNGQTAVLTGNYGVSSSGHLGPKSFRLEKVGSNQVLIGPYEFPVDGLVRLVEFEPLHPDASIVYRAHRVLRRVSSEETLTGAAIFEPGRHGDEIIVDAIDTRKLVAASATSGNRKVEFRVEMIERRNPFGASVEERRIACIEFVEPVAADHAIGAMNLVTSFLSFMVGQPIGFSEAFLYPPNESERRTPPRKFSLHFAKREKADEDTPTPRQSLLSPTVDGEDYSIALRTWLDREDTWRSSYSNARMCLAQRNTIGRSHYLAAAGWFESIPRFYVPEVARIHRYAIHEAAAAAAGAFAIAGKKVPQDRIKALLAPVNELSLRVLIRHAIGYLRRRFSEQSLPESVTHFVPLLTRIRGEYAHGKIPEAEYSPQQIYRCTLLLELLAGLLTLSALPWEFTRLRQADRHHLQDAWEMVFGQTGSPP